MGVYKVPIDLTAEKMYTRHLALLVRGYMLTVITNGPCTFRENLYVKNHD